VNNEFPGHDQGHPAAYGFQRYVAATINENVNFVLGRANFTPSTLRLQK